MSFWPKHYKSKKISGDAVSASVKARNPVARIGVFIAVFMIAGISGYGLAQNSARHSLETVNAVQDNAALYPLKIATKDGSVLIQAELADTQETRAQGLMWRKTLDEGRGMLFLFPYEQNVSFWMRNTLIPLDLIYIAKDGTINHIHPMAKPLDEAPLPSKGGAVIAVLEIGGGQASAKNIQIGDVVHSSIIEGKQE